MSLFGARVGAEAAGQRARQEVSQTYQAGTLQKEVLVTWGHPIPGSVLHGLAKRFWQPEHLL